MLLGLDWLETGLNAAVREEERREFDVEARRAGAEIGGGYNTSAERDHSPNDPGHRAYGTDEEHVANATGGENGRMVAQQPLATMRQPGKLPTFGGGAPGPENGPGAGTGAAAKLSGGLAAGKGGWAKLKAKQSVLGSFVQKDKEDMRNVLKNLNRQEEEARRHGILTEKEVEHNYSIVKEASLESQMTSAEKTGLNKMCWRTLEHVMGTLILTKDFAILLESHKKKVDIREKNTKKDTP